MKTKQLRAKTLDSAQMLLAERGYVVIGIKPGDGTRYNIGQIVSHVWGVNLKQPFAITAVTDHKDWLAQIALIEKRLGYRMKAPEDIETGDAYYRASTD